MDKYKRRISYTPNENTFSQANKEIPWKDATSYNTQLIIFFNTIKSGLKKIKKYFNTNFDKIDNTNSKHVHLYSMIKTLDSKLKEVDINKLDLSVLLHYNYYLYNIFELVIAV